MSSVNILSTLQNKVAQKKAIHHSSSAVFLGIYNPNNGIDTEISLLNHFILKRGITDVVAKVEIRNLNGDLVKSFKLNMDEERVYSVRLGEHFNTIFTGSIYVFFQSNENLAVPFCAVMCSIKSSNSVCGVHSYGRRLEQKELGTNLDIKKTVEMGWTARDSDSIKSFATLHGGPNKLELKVKFEISNHMNLTIFFNRDFILEPYGALLFVPQDYSDEIISHLKGKKGHIRVHIEGLSGIFPRMLCGNFSITSSKSNELARAEEIQFTHTNFDFSTIKQPDAGDNLGYFNQPSIPNGYGIIYPVITKKAISIDGKSYTSNTTHNISIEKTSQVEISAKNENLPSRFVAATIGTWKDASLESECSTGTFIKDYIKIPCHWHWGLLKPGFEKGKSVITIMLNRFNNHNELKRTLKLRLFNEENFLIEQDFVIDSHKEINALDLLPTKLPDGTIWYVLSGNTLEDLNIFSTFYPKDKAGFVEHAF